MVLVHTNFKGNMYGPMHSREYWSILFCFFSMDVRMDLWPCDRPRPTQGLAGPSGPEPRKSPKRVQKEYPGAGSPKVPKECAPESQKSPKESESQVLDFSDSFETPGRTLSALLGPCPGVLFPDSFRTLPGFRARRARETLCGVGPIASMALKVCQELPLTLALVHGWLFHQLGPERSRKESNASRLP